MRLTTTGANGSLHQFTQKVKNKRGEIVEYPKVRGDRDPNNLLHWQFQVTWKEKIDGKWKSRCRWRSLPEAQRTAEESSLGEEGDRSRLWYQRDSGVFSLEFYHVMYMIKFARNLV
jgi:hypothetical protein